MQNVGICITRTANKNQSKNIFHTVRIHLPTIFDIPLFTQLLCYNLYKTTLESKCNFKTSNPHLNWSAESTWWPRKNKSTREECRCRQQLDTDVNGVRQSLQNATLHLCLCTWPKKRLLPTNAVLNRVGFCFLKSKNFQHFTRLLPIFHKMN